MKPVVYALNWVPDFARGQVRDLRVRWALEEAGIAYESKLLTFADKETPDYLAIQPFGQVPVYEDGEVSLFESGAITLHIAEKSETLLPTDASGRARAKMWVFAALSSIEPSIFPFQDIVLFHAGEDWAELRRADAEANMMERLNRLADWLEGKDYLEDRFTIGDLTMIASLRSLDPSQHVRSHPVLGPYVARGEARRAFQRALDAQLSDFTGDPPAQMTG